VHKHLKYISTLGMEREQWLEHRRNSIGGSDAAAIMGMNSYSSPYRIWADKRGLLPETPDNEAMRQGRDLEDYVAQRWCEATGKQVRRRNAIIINPDYPFAHANVDRLVVGEDAGLECKTTSSLNLKRFRDGEYPENYYAQCQHYMAVTGAKCWYLGVLVFGRDFFHYAIGRNDDDIAVLMEHEMELWTCVKNNTPPPADGFDATTDALQTIYANGNGDAIELLGRNDIFQGYFADKAIRDEADKRMETAKQAIMLDLGDGEAGQCDGYRVTWKPQSRKSFDVKSFKAEHPDLDLEDYYKTTTFRTFAIKEEAI